MGRPDGTGPGVAASDPGGELVLKLVYAGPAGSGKTTNLRQLSRAFEPSMQGPLLELGGGAGAAGTLFFDLLPLFLATPATPEASGAVDVRIKVYALPGDPRHGITRRLLMSGADGIAFIADGRRAQASANNRAWADMQRGMDDNHLDRGRVPLVVQLNKMDLQQAGAGPAPPLPGVDLVCPASAATGLGVVATFLGLVSAVMDRQAHRGSSGRHPGGPDGATLVRALEARLADAAAAAGLREARAR